MRWLALTIALLLPATSAQAGSTGVQGGTGAGASNSTIVTWAIGASDGGVRPPAGTSVSQCSRWAPVGFVDPSQSAGTPGPTTRTLPDGEVETLYWRSCAGVLQYVWVGRYSPRQVAELAYQRVIRQLPLPRPAFAPPAEAMIVNLETWFAAAPTGDISATARIPGLSSTVTARPVRLVLDTGSRVAGDQRIIECAPWGSTTANVGGCAWTPRWPSVARATGTSDQRYRATLSIVWDITWSSSAGAGGALGQRRTSTTVAVSVREVQTTGIGG